MPAKLLEVNRAILNQHLARTSGSKVSFTHLIGFAVVRGAAGGTGPQLQSFVPTIDGKGTPGVIRHDHVGLGLAVDVEQDRRHRERCWSRSIRDAESLDFRAFVVAYEDLVRKVHTGKVTPDDFAGATVTLTNPGTLGTVQSVPRLMPGQGAIIGVGALGYPAEFQAADRRSLAAIGVGPVVTLTSTYDHRIIQGAESGMFLTYVAECLTGEHGFYETGLRRHGRALRAGAVAGRRQRRRQRAPAPGEAGACPEPDQHVPGPRPPDRRSRSVVGRAEAPAPRARPDHLRAHPVGPRPRVRGRRAGRAATR